MSALVCAAGLSLTAQGLVRPIWIQVLPQQAGKVYAVGAAPLGGNPALALKQAAQNARLELATRLRASVRGETSLSSSLTVNKALGGATSATSRQQVAQDSTIATQMAELTGLGIDETWQDLPGGTVYALACLDVDAAMGALKGRAQAVETGLATLAAQDPALREAARGVLNLRRGRGELERLLELAEPLTVCGGDPQFPVALQKLQARLERQADGLRAALPLGLAGTLQPELVAILRAAAQQQGFGWVEGPAPLRVRLTQAPLPDPSVWWTQETDGSFFTLRATLRLSLQDGSGHPRGATELEAVGVGPAPAGARQGLVKDLRSKLDATLDHWLNDLAL